ncbi:serine protease [Patulibacter sp.]|uniref:serine protease n=1 Tax=Patulibacter sp. TaxID=1912859 RepID=UPI00271A5D97|nr:serine protease [Patulibacter sp.]MDO9409614.1 serine protease [Patulibacter sp.]
MSHLTSPSTRRRGLPVAGVLVAASALAALAPAGATAADGTTVLRADQQSTTRSTPRIVGGDVAGIASAPYQVRIRAKTDGQAWGTAGRFTSCGGAVLDATHIVTAAHCTINSDNNAEIAPVSYVVDTGFSRFDATPGAGTDPAPQAGDTLQTRSVAAVRRHGGYGRPLGGSGSLEQLADDAAVLTLATPLTFDGNTQPIALADPGPAPSSGDARVTGFGLQSDGGEANGNLYSLLTPVVDPAISQQNGGTGELNALYVTTLAPGGSTCQGDSGGPLVQNGRLIGIVSSGPKCGANTPSYFTNVTAPEVRDFILGNDTPALAPRGGQNVSLSISSSPKVNDVATCAAGTWTNGPTFSYRFTDTKSGRILAEGPSATYKLKAADAGATISCRVFATTPGGVGVTPATAASNAVAALPPAPKPDPARLTTSIVSGSSKVKQGSRVSFRVTVRNTGDVTARTVRTCVRVSSRFSIVSRGGATLSGGRLCWTNSRLASTTTKRFSLRADRDARAGRTTAATVSVTSTSTRSASARRAVTIQRRATAVSPGGVTG